MNSPTILDITLELEEVARLINAIRCGPWFMYSSPIDVKEHLHTISQDDIYPINLTPALEDGLSGPPGEGQPGAEALGTAEEAEGTAEESD